MKWEMVKLGEICKLVTGKTPPTANEKYFGGEVLWVTPSDFIQKEIIYTKRTLAEKAIAEKKCNPLPAKTVLLSCIGEIGKVGILPLGGTTNQQITALIPTEKVDSNYLYFLLSNQKSELNQLANNAVVPILNNDRLKTLLIPLPPLATQRRIAEILDKADALRQKDQALLRKYDELAQAVFVDMFGDPVRNEKGWEIVEIGNKIDLITGYPFKSQDYVNNQDAIKLCGGLIIMPDKIDWPKTNYYPINKVFGLDKYLLKHNDIVIAMDRPWISNGFKIGLIENSDLPALLVQRTARLRAINMNQYYLFYILNRKSFEIHCKPTETTVPHISPNDIRKYKVPFPPIELQNQFESKILNVRKQMVLLKTNHSDSLFQSLLQKAFTGELVG